MCLYWPRFWLGDPAQGQIVLKGMAVSFICPLRRASLLTVNANTVVNRDFCGASCVVEIVQCCLNLAMWNVIIYSKKC